MGPLIRPSVVLWSGNARFTRCCDGEITEIIEILNSDYGDYRDCEYCAIIDIVLCRMPRQWFRDVNGFNV